MLGLSRSKGCGVSRVRVEEEAYKVKENIANRELWGSSGGSRGGTGKDPAGKREVCGNELVPQDLQGVGNATIKGSLTRAGVEKSVTASLLLCFHATKDETFLSD